MSDENKKSFERADSKEKNNPEDGNVPVAVAVKEPTSPGQLQDVTMDNSYAIGYRSPCVSLQQYTGSTSPAQGRSVREFEEQMATLRKENFNLKLRLYFIEESIPGYSQSNNSDGQETLMKQLIDTKVEMEILRKEIQEKQDLLKEAAQALNQMEKIQKDTELKSQLIIDDLNHKIQCLEMENKEMEKSQTGQLMDELLGRSDVSSNINALQKIRELEGIVTQSEEKINDFQNQIYKLDDILTRRDQTIRECEDKVKELVFKNSELLEQLENKDKEIATVESQRLREELQDQKRQLADKTCMLEDTEEKLKERTTQHEQACKAIQKLMLNIKNLQDEIDRLKKNNTSSSSHIKESSSNAAECSGLCRSLSDTEGIAESISLRARMDKLIEQKDSEIHKLKAEVKKKTANLQNLVNKELWEKNREIERLTKLINKPNSLPTSPNKEAEQLKQSFTDTEYAHALERNKVLQKKVDILIQRLSAPTDRNADPIIRQLKAEVKEAKEEAERADKWRKECADVCSILTARLEELAGFLDSLLKHKDVLGALAADRRRAMRKAVDRSLDLSKSLNNMSLSITGMSMMDHSLAQISNLSEILDFSTANKENKTFNSHEELHGDTIETLQAELKALKKELDKTKNTEVKKDRRSLPIAFENHSESEAWSEPDRKVSLARIGLEETRAPKISKEERSTDSESELNQSRSKSKTQDKIIQLENMISQKDDKILEIQCELVEADNRLKRENLRVIDMTRELEELKDHNADLQSELAIYKNNQGAGFDANSLVRQLEEKNRSLIKIQDERDRITVEARIAELQIESLKSEMEDIKQKHHAAISQANEEERQKLDELQAHLTGIMERRLKEQEEKHTDSLARDWIARRLYEEHTRQFEQLQKKLAEAESTIDYLTENEAEMKQSLVENELSMRALKKNLDESTLQASRAVLERTKALNEKLQLETRTQELVKQIQTLEAEKTEMISKITALEQQKLSQRKSSNHGSDISQSGYTSEEVPVGTGRTAVGGQRVNNSSPDLGIESDAGRVSSVELSNAHLSKLKTVELKAKQMIHEEAVEGSNSVEINDGAQQTAPTTAPTITHDCAKVDQENAELRSKLIRTKRALQDTYNKLRTANQRKEQVEKEIKNQILKTHNVLKNVRSNMENEL